ncbi:alpha-ketoglutarate-dependent dioxygenase AlkB [Pedobacter psychrotolerans]|uniref:alpha-ketoglutarate-dependent dioxygenase AlkB n=1 Tax=Pedobacter psychrotolerans TaxID=1843235 RepID=UPI003F97E9F1
MKTTAVYDLFNPAPEFLQLSETQKALDDCSKVISGLTYVKEFISQEEEQKLLKTISEQEWLGDLKRRVQHYGWKYDYKARSLNSSMYLGPLPPWAKNLAERLFEKNLMSELADQVIINEYLPGQGIANHVDCEPCFGDTIVSLSLATPCIMNFINLESKEKRETQLDPRSAVSIKGESRYQWSHGIPARLADDIDGIRTNRKTRISVTFRKVII